MRAFSLAGVVFVYLTQGARLTSYRQAREPSRRWADCPRSPRGRFLAGRNPAPNGFGTDPLEINERRMCFVVRQLYKMNAFAVFCIEMIHGVLIPAVWRFEFECRQP